MELTQEFREQLSGWARQATQDYDGKTTMSAQIHQSGPLSSTYTITPYCQYLAAVARPSVILAYEKALQAAVDETQKQLKAQLDQLASALPAPPAAAEAQGLGAGRLAVIKCDMVELGAHLGAEGQFTPGMSEVAFYALNDLLAAYDALAARLATLEAAGAAGGREAELMRLVDVVWQYVREDMSLPSTALARKLIAQAATPATPAPKQQPEAEGGQADG